MEARGREDTRPVAVARLGLSKSGPARFVSHLDFIRAIERAARRAGLPLVLSSGFHPHPRMSFSPALAVGVSSECEFADVELREARSPAEVAERIGGRLPPGIGLVSCSIIAPGGPALSSAIRAAAYRLDYRREDVGAPEETRRAIDRLFQADEIVVTRQTPKGVRQVDIRPFIHEVWFTRGEELASLHLLAALGGRGSVRPLHVAEALADLGALRPGARPVEVTREGLFVLREGKLVSPQGAGTVPYSSPPGTCSRSEARCQRRSWSTSDPGKPGLPW